jgi:hypothetical protein
VWWRCSIPVDRKKLHETELVRGCGSRWMRWLGRGSVVQMYCALLLSGTLIFQADASANMLEVVHGLAATTAAAYS